LNPETAIPLTVDFLIVVSKFIAIAITGSSSIIRGHPLSDGCYGPI